MTVRHRGQFRALHSTREFSISRGWSPHEKSPAATRSRESYTSFLIGVTAMKSRWMVMSLFVATLVAVGGLKAAKEEAAKKEFKATCPVSGKPAGEDHMVVAKNGDKVYFCCDNCPKAYKANPKKFDTKVNAQL